MKIKLLLTVSLSFIVANCFAQNSFQRAINTITQSAGNAVQQTTDGGYIIAGEAYFSNPDGNNVYLIKTNSIGDTLWKKVLGGSDDDAGYSVQQTKDGGYIVAGNTLSFGTNGDVYIIKTDSAGNVVWAKAYGGGNLDDGFFIQQTNDSGYIVTGITDSYGAGGLDVYLLKLNSDGSIAWTKTYGGPGDEEGECVQQTADSGYIICGFTSSFGAGSWDIYLVKTAANGDTLWTRSYGGTGTDEGYDVKQTNDGGYIVTGYTASFGDGNDDVYLIKTDAGGDTLWTKTYGGASDDRGYSVLQTNDSGYVVCGYTGSFGAGNDDVYAIKTDKNGDTLWTKTYGGDQDDEGYSINSTTDGGYVIAGNSVSFFPPGYFGGIYLIKTDADGNSDCYEGTAATVVGSMPCKVKSTQGRISSGGTENITFTIANSTGDDSSLCFTVSVHELVNNNTISLYPNPTDNQFTVYGLQFTHSASLEIYDVLGKLVKTQAGNWKTEETVDVSTLPSGIYFVRVADEKQSWIGKFIKE